MTAWILVFHLTGLVFWLGSLLVVTHILAFHSEEPSMEVREALGRLEVKLLKGLAHPGAAVMVISGIIMIGVNPHYLREHWLQAKSLLVALLIILDLRVYFRTTAFLAGRVELRRRECMALHGAISLVFFAILILVLLKPFTARVRQAYAPVRFCPRAGFPTGPWPEHTAIARLSNTWIVGEFDVEAATWRSGRHGIAATFGGTLGEDHCKQERLTAD
jgi:putative membrane protein